MMLYIPKTEQENVSLRDATPECYYFYRYHHNYKYPRTFYMSLKVGQREFIGEGATRQDARHNAAHKALNILRNLPLPNQQPIKKTPEASGTQEEAADAEGIKK